MVEKATDPFDGRWHHVSRYEANNRGTVVEAPTAVPHQNLADGHGAAITYQETWDPISGPNPDSGGNPLTMWRQLYLTPPNRTTPMPDQ